ncbi:MAG: hypothetical protein ACRDY1_12695 [Acidimicrobiales bacterium]
MDVDVRRVGRLAVALVLVAVAATSVALFVAGAHRNDQIDQLHGDGRPVAIHITGCLGLLGGSGSNAAGYSCHGTLTFDGRRYSEAIPGDALHQPGQMLRGVAVAGDPPLIDTAAHLATEQASDRVFILPAVLLALVVVALAGLALRRRSPGPAPDA